MGFSGQVKVSRQLIPAFDFIGLPAPRSVTDFNGASTTSMQRPLATPIWSVVQKSFQPAQRCVMAAYAIG
jgi:hypothetical protein